MIRKILFLFAIIGCAFGLQAQIPDNLRINTTPRPAQQFDESSSPAVKDLTTLSVGTMIPVFNCTGGKYYVGFQLFYDLSDFNTVQSWNIDLKYSLYLNGSPIGSWTNQTLNNTLDNTVSPIVQKFISTAFYNNNTPVDCSSGYQVRIESVTINSGTPPLAKIFFKIILAESITDVYDPMVGVTSLSSVYNSAAGTVLSTWNPPTTGGAKAVFGYDLEWVFVDTDEAVTITSVQDAFSQTPATARLPKEAVRITTAATSFTHQCYYPSGTLYYRVRRIGWNPSYPDQRFPGVWVYSSAITVTNPQPDKNWQQQTVYAEDGKYKKVMSYFDKTLRQRQVLTNLSTSNLTLVGESRYDYEGRKSIDILPVPASDASLKFKPNFNVFATATDATIKAFVTSTNRTNTKFHYDNKILQNSTLNTTTGASYYYSTASYATSTSIAKAYIPSAEGFPFSQTEYVNDGTGRATEQSGVGLQFKVDGVNTTQDYYGTAAPAEIARLFGSNVGYANHYKKNMVIDANGQASITYVDQEGRTIATALAGAPPVNVLALDSYTTNLATATPITVDLTSKNEIRDGNRIITQKLLNIVSTNYNFNYSLYPKGAIISTDNIGCVECKFNILITGTDPDGLPLNFSSVAGNESTTPASAFEKKNVSSIDCNSASTNTYLLPLTFSKVGEYTITKTLIPYELSYTEAKTLVKQTANVQSQIATIQGSYSVNNADCSICTTCATPSVISTVINEITQKTCDNILQQIIDAIKTSKNDVNYVPTQAEINSHPDKCRYDLCIKNSSSDAFDKSLATISGWSAALTAYGSSLANLTNILLDKDPFFNNLTGYGQNESGLAYKATMQSKLNSITIFNNVPVGSITQIIDPTLTTYYVDNNGVFTNAINSTSYHLLYFDLMKRNKATPPQISAANYTTQFDAQRWTLYKSYYLEAKRQIKLNSISEYSYASCPSAFYELTAVKDDLPVTYEQNLAWANGQINTGTGTAAGIQNYQTSLPISNAEIASNIALLKSKCHKNFSTADSLSIAGSLIAYFASNPANPFRVILTADLNHAPPDANLAAINSVLSHYTCDLSSVSQINPIQCAHDTTIVVHRTSDNLVVNPDFKKMSDPTCTGYNGTCSANVINNSTSTAAECYKGWTAPSGAPTVNAAGDIVFLSSSNCTSASLMGTLTNVLNPYHTYKIYVTYKVASDATYTLGRMDQLYCQFFQNSNLGYRTGISGSTSCTTNTMSLSYNCSPQYAPIQNPGGAQQLNQIAAKSSGTQVIPLALLACCSPGAVTPDNVTISGTATDKALYLSNLTNSGSWVTSSSTFTPTQYSTNFVFSIFSSVVPGTSTPEGIYLKDITIVDVLSDITTTVCLKYDTTAIKKYTVNVPAALTKAINECNTRAAVERDTLISLAINKVVDAEIATYYANHITNCLASSADNFNYTYTPTEYHYTLYYYDQSSKLVQTVPPNGVNPLTLQSQIDQAIASTITNSNPIYPNHTLATRYYYNSLNQSISQSTPDAGNSQFFYNSKSQLRLSQNAQQAIDQKYSYTKYDNQGRIIEVGELYSSAPQATLTSQLDDANFPAAANYTLQDVTKTFYDAANPSLTGFTQKYLRSRVSWVEVHDKNTTDVITTSYSYDIHGNVQALLQQIPGLADKRVDYIYDLVSGKVNYVLYNASQTDRFFHKYSYDADNRITKVQTSTDGYLWDTDGTYLYYQHGPLARTQLGEYYGVQGLDYYYTLQGWIRGMNMPYTGDPNNDGYTNRVGRDVMSYSLGYFQNDYKNSGNLNVFGSFSGTVDKVWTRYNALYTSTNKGLYNGNIAWMVTDLKKVGQAKGNRAKGLQAMLYRYDQLHRIRQSRSLINYVPATGFPVTNNAYNEDFTYDENGNLLTTQRKNDAAVLKDNFTYTYYPNSNKLRYLYPIVRDTTYSGNIVSSNKIYRNITIMPTATVANGADVTLKAVNNISLTTAATDNFDLNDNAVNFHAYVLDTDEGAYNYDAIGNLIWDQDQGVKIEWTPYGKVRKVSKADGSYLAFRYDGAGNRIQKKQVKADNSGTVTRYVRDASGNVMTVYSSAITAGAEGTVTMLEQPIYGSSRLGMYKGGRTDGVRNMGTKNYELSNHLGNVLTVINDYVNYQADSAWATVVNANDYYAFGSPMPNRSYSSSTYRYGFNGKEQDTESTWGDTQYDYGFRIYDPKIARFLSVDPLSQKFPMLTPYQFASNTPLQAIDLEGLEAQVSTSNNTVFTRLKNVDFKFVARNSNQFFTDAAYDDKDFDDFTINTQMFDYQDPIRYFMASKPQPVTEYTPQGYNVSNGRIVSGRSSKATFYFAQNSTNCNWTIRMGDVPKESFFGFGGGTPIIVNGLKYGVGNVYKPGAPKGLPETGPPGEENMKYLLQRNNGVYAGQNDPFVGKTVLGFNSKNNEWIIVSQRNGSKGFTLDQIRDMLSREGYDNVLGFDGSTSATLIQNKTIVVSPDKRKNSTMTSGINLQVPKK